jgi:type IV pilus assembly protein PilV
MRNNKMNITPPVRATKAQQGVVLLEALIAILIFSLGVLGLVGLQATMIKSTSEAKFRSEASFIAQQKIGQMWADPLALPDDLYDVVDISTLLPNGTRLVTQPVAGQFMVVVTWQQPGEPVHNFTTIASINGG